MPVLNRQGPSIAYDAVGPVGAPAVLLAHGFLCDRQLFDHQVDALRQRYRVIAVDLRGHGRSGLTDAPFTLYDLVDDLMAVLDAERVPHAVWVGHSMGGFVCLRAALRHPARVRALVLMHTQAGPETLFGLAKFSLMRWALQTLGPRRLASVVLPVYLGRSSLREQPALRRMVLRQLRAISVQAAAQGLRMLVARDDVRGGLGRVRCPTLVLAGDEDRALAAERTRDLARRIPLAEWVVLPRCGHLSPWEAPQAVNTVLEDFLVRLARMPALAA